MVKKICAGLALLLSGFSHYASQPSLVDLGEPFPGDNVEIVWGAPMNKLPTDLGIFKVLPAVFSQNVISNIVALGEFKQPEKVFAALQKAAKGQTASYQEAETGKYISISPERGRISYLNHRAKAGSREPAEGIPSKPKTLELALDLLEKFGISRTNLACKPESEDLLLLHIQEEHGSFDKSEGKVVKRTVMNGVMFYRAVNGVAFSGIGPCGGAMVRFGNYAKVCELEIVWRNLKLDRPVSIASQEQFIRWIKDGKANIEYGEGVDPRQIKKLAVTQIRPCYLGKSGIDIQKVVYPYAVLTATADMGHTNVVVNLNCSIFK